MEGNFPDQEEMDRVTRLAEQVLDDPAFQRSPVLARLLRYLIAKTAAHEATKSYAIAFEGLGKQGRHQADADTYARVAVARLRKALAAYYATHKDVEQIHVDSGTYQVRLRRDGATAGEIHPRRTDAGGHAWPGRLSPLRSRGWLVVAVIALILVAAGALLIERKARHDAAMWRDTAFPSLGVVSEDGTGGAAIPPAQLTAQKQELIASLEQHQGFVVVDRGAADTDFVIQLSLSSRGGLVSQTVTLTERATGIVIWAKTYPESGTNWLGSVTSSAVAAIAPPNGSLMGHLRRKGYDVASPIGCWLRFTEGVQTFNTNGDAKLRDCAEDWYENAPERRHAAFLYAWTLIDAAAMSRNASDKTATLQRAFSVLHRAIALNPDFALFHLAAMRGHAIEGNRALVLQSGADAVRTSEHNRLVVGMAASILTFWNDPSGERILLELDRGGGVAYPWEHVGLFTAAMMRDDTLAAGQQVMMIEKFADGQPLLLIIKAAYASRVGKPQDVAAAFNRLHASPLIRLVGTDALVRRLPIAPEVGQRLREWLPKDP